MKRCLQLAAIVLVMVGIAGMTGCGTSEPASTPPATTSDGHYEGDGHDHGEEGHEGHDHEGESQ